MLHGHAHERTWPQRIPVYDLKSFWGMLPRAEKDHRLRAASSSERQIRDAYKRSAAGNSTGDNPRCFARAGTLFTWNVMLY
jgi:hypothetical protein